MIKVEVDPGAGFCFGVDQVIKTAESLLQKGEPLYGLGDMVHNSEEMSRLQAMGLKTIDHAQLRELKPERILLRAHGEPPSTYHLASKFGIAVIDGTCPIVSRLQKKIREVYAAMDHQTQQLVIFGKPDHPETIGLLGQVQGDAKVVSSAADVYGIDPSKNVRLFSQTTMDPDLFKEVETALKDHLIQKASQPGEILFQSDCTICGQMKKRKPGLASFARQHELILFVSGKNSSNGKMLYEFCVAVNPSTKWISASNEVDPSWFTGVSTVGISGATSTSLDQLNEVRDRVNNLIL